MKSTKGFTLVELVIVIVIVGILSIVAVPIYRGYLRKAMATEGKSLLGSVQTAEKVYFAEHSAFLGVTNTSNSTVLDVDARTNKYFTAFAVTGGTSGFTASTTGTGDAKGISLTLTTSNTGTPSWTDSGLNN